MKINLSRSRWIRIICGQSLFLSQFCKLCIIISLLTVAVSSVISAESPKATIDNGILHASVYLPDAAHGFYRGTRFDWSGVIGDLTFAGHSYYGPWFTKMDPKVRDFIFDGPDITAGMCSAITGPAEEFLSEDGSALGFNQAAPGQTFVKIGVGTLRKPDDQQYSSFRQYEIVDSGKWKVHIKPTSIEFTQTIVDKNSGYGYSYTKILRLESGRPVLIIDHSLKNLGRLPILSSVYDHNFLVLDHQITGPDFSISLPFPITPKKPIKADLGIIEGNRILYRRKLKERDMFTVDIGGFGPTSRDYDIRIENSRLRAGVRITGDQPLEKEELWSIRSLVAMEPFVHLTVAPGKTVHWSYSYLYYTLTQ